MVLRVEKWINYGIHWCNTSKIIIISIVPAIVVALWIKVKTKPAITPKERNSKQQAAAKKHLIYTFISILSLVLSVPIILIILIGAGMSPGNPHMGYGEFTIGVLLPIVIFITQYLDFRTIIHTPTSKIFSLIIIAIASLEMLYVVLLKLAG